MVYLPKKASQLINVLIGSLEVMRTQERWRFDSKVFTIKIMWQFDKAINWYGILGAVGIAVLEQPYNFMPEDYENKNSRRLWAIHYLSKGWVKLALLELQSKKLSKIEMISLPEIDDGFEEYVNALRRLETELKKEGL